MKIGGSAAALLTFRRKMYGFSQTNPLRKFITPLQGLGPTGIPVASPDGTVVRGSTVATHYTIDIRQFQQQLHPDLGGSQNANAYTKLWGYGQGGAGNHRHLGGVIVTKRNAPVQVTFRNYLPTNHLLNQNPNSQPVVDAADFFADAAVPQNKVAVHLHGGFIPWISDGGPFDWFSDGTLQTLGDPTSWHGPSFVNNSALGKPDTPGCAEYYWPNDQSSRLMWYHDHGHDLTRINAYAGIATAYIVRDDQENALIRSGIIPSAEVPLVFQDKIFWPDGSLWYPWEYDPLRWMTAQNAGITPYGTPPAVSAIPEMFGDTPLVNGTPYPQVELEPRRYRLRLLNACNARFLNLNLVVDDGTTEGLTLNNLSAAAGNALKDPWGTTVTQTYVDSNGVVYDPNQGTTGTPPVANAPVKIPNNAAGPAMLQIGNECGFLFAPVEYPAVNPITFDASMRAMTHNLLLAPAERADVIIDLKNYANQYLILYNDAPAPFPGGDPLNDYYVGSPNPGTTTTAGLGPNTRTLMRIKVKSSITGTADRYTWQQLKSVFTTQLAKLTATLPDPGAPGTRNLTLNEEFDAWGRLIQRVGTDVQDAPANRLPVDPVAAAQGLLDYGRPFMSPATEQPTIGAVEKWKIWNLTGDTHPMHFHLINALITERADFDGITVNGATSNAKTAEPCEVGWKETIRINPGEVVTFIAKFDLPKVPFTVPQSPRLAAEGILNAHEYVYHCHILEHEEHDMMRPLAVKP